MDTIDPDTDAPAVPAPPAPAPKSAGRSQSKIPAIVFWVLAAAVLFRAATVLLNRGGKEAESASGLVRWEPRDQATATAGSRQKPVLYDFTAAWCGPCHRLDEEGWGDAKVAELVNSSYVPARIVDREREDGKNPPPIEELQKKYSVSAFPTLVVAAPDGREVARMEGYGGKERLVRFLKDARTK